MKDKILRVLKAIPKKKNKKMKIPRKKKSMKIRMILLLRFTTNLSSLATSN